MGTQVATLAPERASANTMVEVTEEAPAATAFPSEVEVFGIVYRTVAGLVRRPEDLRLDELDDIVQDALLAVVRAREAFEGRCSPENYIRGICVKTLLATRRRRGRWRRVFDFFRSNEPNGQAPEYATVNLTPELTEARRAIDRLPEELRLLVLLHAEGRKQQELADVFGVSTVTVRNRLRRAYQLMRGGEPAGRDEEERSDSDERL